MKNIILITVDTLRFDYSKIITDKMNKVLGKGIDFKKAYSTGPSSSMSYIGFLSSKYPISPDEKNTIFTPKINRNRTLLFEVLKNNNYKTYVIANSLFHKYYGYDKGIDEMVYKKLRKERKTIKERLRSKIIPDFLYKKLIKVYRNYEILAKKKFDVPYYDAKEVTEIVKDILNKENNNKIFMHINYMDTHSPPNLSNDYISKNISKKNALNCKLGVGEITRIREKIDKSNKNANEIKDVKDILTLYEKLYNYETLYAADHIYNLLKYFEETGKLNDTIFIFHSDHGEYLWPEGKLLGHGLPMINKEDALNVFYDNLVHVPLIFWGLGEKTVQNPVSLVDLSPTILELIGIKKPPEWYGESLFLKKEKPVVIEDVRHGSNCYSIRTNKWFFVYNEETKQQGLFENKNTLGANDLSNERRDVIEEMHKYLQLHNSNKTKCWKQYHKKNIKNIFIKKGENGKT